MSMQIAANMANECKKICLFDVVIHKWANSFFPSAKMKKLRSKLHLLTKHDFYAVVLLSTKRHLTK